MGIYIKGFKFPEKSDMYYVKVECEAGKNSVATIWRKDLLGEMSFGAFEVIPVPPHGDLVERDKLRQTMFIGEQCLYSWDEIEDAIDFSPTVIPAEE